MNVSQPHPAQDALQAAFEALPKTSARTRAFAHFAQTGLPHRRMEAWKWTDLRAALAKDLTAQSGTSKRLNIPANAFVVRITGGQLAHTPDLPEGVQMSIGDVSSHETDLPMLGLADALAPTCLTLHIDGKIDDPLYLVFEGHGHANVAVMMAAKAQAQIIEGHGVNNGFANTAVRYEIGEGAKLTRLVHQHGGEGAVHAICTEIKLAQSARLDQFSLSFGARRVRQETQLLYTGVDARAQLNGAYLLDGERHSDQTFHVEHAKMGCSTRQLVRGVVKDHACGVFQGKFYVARGGQHTDAKMAHDAVLLNAGASVNAKPELEIYADDVVCTHGNTAGALDENALFYMRQRGLDEAQAKALLIHAFLGAAFDDLKDEALHDALLSPVMNWLEGAL